MPERRASAAAPNLVQNRLVAGKHHTVYADLHGNAFAWGGGDAHGEEDPPPAYLPPVKDRDLHHMGMGVDVGACVPRPYHMRLAGVIVKEISAGPQHTLILATGGDVWSCGCGAHGRLGHGDDLNLRKPRRIEHLQNHGGRHPQGGGVRVSAGETHSLVVSELGVVYSFGSGISGRHGHVDTTHQWFPRALTALQSHVIVDADAGAQHSFAIGEEGELWAWGAGGSGQLGFGDVKADFVRREPTRVKPLAAVPVRQASAGAAHSLVVARNGNLFSFGFGAYGRLGHGDRRDMFSPKLVEGPLAGVPVRCAAAGEDHSIVLTNAGEVYAFGSNAHGKLGLGIERKLELPADVNDYLEEAYAEPDRAKHEVQQVYAFGRNTSSNFGGADDVAIGHGQAYVQATPRRVEALRGETVLRVAAGHEHSAVEIRNSNTNLNELFTFGSNASGQLGLPWAVDPDDKSVPTKVESHMLEEAKKGSALSVKAKGMNWRKEALNKQAKEVVDALAIQQSIFAGLGITAPIAAAPEVPQKQPVPKSGKGEVDEVMALVRARRPPTATTIPLVKTSAASDLLETQAVEDVHGRYHAQSGDSMTANDWPFARTTTASLLGCDNTSRSSTAARDTRTPMCSGAAPFCEDGAATSHSAVAPTGTLSLTMKQGASANYDLATMASVASRPPMTAPPRAIRLPSRATSSRTEGPPPTVNLCPPSMPVSAAGQTPRASRFKLEAESASVRTGAQGRVRGSDSDYHMSYPR